MSKTSLLALVAGTLLLGACASQGLDEQVAAVYVSPDKYSKLNCKQLEAASKKTERQLAAFLAQNATANNPGISNISDSQIDAAQSVAQQLQNGVNAKSLLNALKVVNSFTASAGQKIDPALKAQFGQLKGDFNALVEAGEDKSCKFVTGVSRKK